MRQWANGAGGKLLQQQLGLMKLLIVLISRPVKGRGKKKKQPCLIRRTFFKLRKRPVFLPACHAKHQKHVKGTHGNILDLDFQEESSYTSSGHSYVSSVCLQYTERVVIMIESKSERSCLTVSLL